MTTAHHRDPEPDDDDNGPWCTKGAAMTRPEAGLTASALTLTAAGTACATHELWWETGLLTLIAFYCYAGAHMERRHRRARERAIAVRLEHLHPGRTAIEPPSPCCPFWTASAGMVHGPDCHTLPGLEVAHQELLDACCERWWTSLETDHDPACRHQLRSSAA